MLRLMEIVGERNGRGLGNKMVVGLMENGYIEGSIKEVGNRGKEVYGVCKKL